MTTTVKEFEQAAAHIRDLLSRVPSIDLNVSAIDQALPWTLQAKQILDHSAGLLSGYGADIKALKASAAMKDYRTQLHALSKAAHRINQNLESRRQQVQQELARMQRMRAWAQTAGRV